MTAVSQRFPLSSSCDNENYFSVSYKQYNCPVPQNCPVLNSAYYFCLNRSKGSSISCSQEEASPEQTKTGRSLCLSRYNYPPNYTEDKCTVVLPTGRCILIVMFNSLYTNIKKLSKKCHQKMETDHGIPIYKIANKLGKLQA